MKRSAAKSKHREYRRFFKKMRGQGMFKAAMFDGYNYCEYNYPGIRMDPWKAELIVLFILIITLFIVIKTSKIVNFNFALNMGETHIEERVDKFGMSNLHRAVINGKEKIVLKLIKYGVDLNVTDDYGWAPLHWAKFLKRERIARLLINHGALTDIRSEKRWYIYKKGITPDEIN